LILSMWPFLQTLQDRSSKTWLPEPCSWKKGEKSKAMMTRSPIFYIILQRAMNVRSYMWIYHATPVHSFSQQITVSLYHSDADTRNNLVPEYGSCKKWLFYRLYKWCSDLLNASH
jgi:hypothetical protein